MKQQLTEALDFNQKIISDVPVGIVVYKASGQCIMANEALARIIQGTVPQILKQDFRQLEPWRTSGLLEAAEKTLATRNPQEGEFHFTSTFGKEVWVAGQFSHFVRNNEPHLLFTMHDITERKRVEARFAQTSNLMDTLLATSDDLIYFKDVESRFIRYSASVAALDHQRRGVSEDLIGKTDFDISNPEHAGRAYEDEQRIIRTGEPVISKIEKETWPDGRVTWALTSKMPLRNANNEIIGTFGITKNITERKQAEEALCSSEAKLRQFTTQLERSNRELQDFASVVSHDLQEPLRKIAVFGERLKEKGGERLDAESRDYLERMQMAASRMQTLINDLLAFSRVTTKAQPFSQVDLTAVAREVVTDLEGRIELVKGRVEVGTLPLIDAEPLHMRQLLQNLIGNALKFRRPDTPPVVKVAAQIITGPSPDGGTTVARKLCRLTVSDNGIGFHEKYLDRIFNVFQRLHSRNEYEGTGMGLAIARKIALFHRGEITAKSQPGEGTTFIVTLPVTHPKEPQTTRENHT